MMFEISLLEGYIVFTTKDVNDLLELNLLIFISLYYLFRVPWKREEIRQPLYLAFCYLFFVFVFVFVECLYCKAKSRALASKHKNIKGPNI